MKSHRQELWLEVEGRRGFVNLTEPVRQAVRDSGIREGLVLVNAMHITASVFINDDESGLHHDYERWLERLAPHEPVRAYRHNETGEDNGDVKAECPGGPGGRSTPPAADFPLSCALSSAGG